MTGELIDIIDCLEKGGFGDMRIKTVKLILLFYNLGPLRRPEVRKITGLSDTYMGNALITLWRMGILDKIESHIPRQYEYKLNKCVRRLIDDSKNGIYRELD